MGHHLRIPDLSYTGHWGQSIPLNSVVAFWIDTILINKEWCVGVIVFHLHIPISVTAVSNPFIYFSIILDNITPKMSLVFALSEAVSFKQFLFIFA